MRLLARARALAVCATALFSVDTMAQDKNGPPSGPPPRERIGPTTSGDVIAQPVVPAPEDGNIILKFRDTPTQIYFRRPIKAVRIEDDLLVSAEPKSDHIIAFTGLSPGRSSITVESKDGTSTTYGLVTVVREPHLVKIYQRTEINRQSGERRSDSSSAIGGYVTLNCNEIGCSELEPEIQPRLPR